MPTTISKLNVILNAITRPFTSGLMKARKALKAFNKQVFNSRNLIKLAVVSLAAFGTAAFAVKKAMDFETMQVQLGSLLGSLDAGKKKFQELVKFAAKTPFQVSSLVDATRTLEAFGGAALNNEKILTALGDAASTSGRDISDITRNAGKLFAAIQIGRGLGQGAAELQEWGIISAGARVEMEKLQKAGASADVVFKRFLTDIERFSGGMAQLSETGAGLVSTLKDNLSIAFAEVGKAWRRTSRRTTYVNSQTRSFSKQPTPIARSTNCSRKFPAPTSQPAR